MRTHGRGRIIRQRGVTLVELMVVVAVVAILGMMAMGSYRNYVLRANRADGMTQLLRIQVAQEKFFLQNGAYVTDNATMLAAPNANPPGLGVASATTPGGHYTLALAPRLAGNTATYVATATAAGTQVADNALCQVFSIDDQGTRVPADASGCWR